MRRQLGQVRPGVTTAVSILSEVRPWEVDLIVICNTTDQPADFSVYHDSDGSTYDATTALMYQAAINPNDTVHYEPMIPIANVDGNGNLAVQTDTASALTFTIYGTLQGDRV